MSYNYYKRKRIKKGLVKSDIARELGIDYKRYNAIEKGEIKMPTKLINKFNEIINKGELNTIEKLNNEKRVNEFWEEMTTIIKGKTRKLQSKCKEFNIATYQDLANLLGCSYGTLSRYVNDTCTPNYDFKNKVYQFFQDETNIQIPSKVKNTHGRACVNKDLLEWFNKTDFVKTLEEMDLSIIEFAKKSGASVNTIRTMVAKRVTPSKLTLTRAKRCIDDFYANNNTIDTSTNDTIEDVTEDTIEILEEKLEDIFPEIGAINENEHTTNDTKYDELIKKYQEELDTLNEICEMYKTRLQEITLRTQTCKEIINVINELRNEG